MIHVLGTTKTITIFNSLFQSIFLVVVFTPICMYVAYNSNMLQVNGYSDDNVHVNCYSDDMLK